MYDEKEAYLYIIEYIIKNNIISIQNLIKSKKSFYPAELTDYDNSIVNAFWALEIDTKNYKYEFILDNVYSNITIKEKKKSFFDKIIDLF